MSKRILLLALTGALACNDKGSTPAGTGAPAADPEAKTAEQLAIEQENQQVVPKKSPPQAPNNDVALTFEGAFEATLEGKGGTCAVSVGGPMPATSWQVQSTAFGATPEFELSIIAEEGAAFDNPTVIVNVRGAERASYVRNRANKKKPETEKLLKLARDGTSAELDLVLQRFPEKGEPLHVVGTIRCEKPVVTKF